MNAPPPVEISILRAAAFDAGIFSELPHPRQPPAQPENLPAHSQTSDPLANILLQLATSVLTDLPPHLRQQTAIILGTPHGCLHADWEFDRSRREAHGRYASPAAFSRTLPSTLPAELSVKLALQGPLLTISASTASTALALRRAASWMQHLKISHCLTGGFDAGTAPTSQPRAALILLSQRAEPSVRKLLLTSPASASTSVPADGDSLTQIITWIQTARDNSQAQIPFTLHPGLQLL